MTAVHCVVDAQSVTSCHFVAASCHTECALSEAETSATGEDESYIVRVVCYPTDFYPSNVMKWHASQ